MHVRVPLRSLAATVLSAVVSTTLVGTPLAGPASADAGPVPLGMTSLSDVVLDEAHRQLFLSPGRSGPGVTVTDLSGGSVQTIDLPGASGMALTPDGRSLWVAVPTAGLARIDTSSLTVEQRIPLPTGVCAGDVAVVGSRLVYGHSCNSYVGSGDYGGIGVVDAVTGASYGTNTGGPFYRPVVAAGPAGQVYAADSLVSPTGLHLFDVTGAAPSPIASRASVCSNLRDLSASPDGSRVVTSCGPDHEHKIYVAADKLALSGSYPTGSYPLAGAWSADGTTFAAGIDSAYEPDVYVFRSGWNAPARIVDFGSTQALLKPRGLAVSGDGSRVWAVTGTTSTALALQVIDVPGPDTGMLTLSAVPRAFYPGGTTTLSGRLSTVAGEPLGGEVVRVSRAATGEAPVLLPSVTTAPDGTFSFPDTPARDGSYLYSVFRDADAARAETSVLVWSVEGSLYLDLTRGTSGGTPVYGTVRLYYQGGDSAAGLSATVVRQVPGTLPVTLPSLTLDANGGTRFTDDAPAGDVTYTVTVAANGIHPEATTSRTTTVLTATELTASAPSSAVVGTPLTVKGGLLHPAGPVAGAHVLVARSGCGTAWSATTTTSADGSWSVPDAPPAGSCSYRASYAGGNGFASSTSPSVSTTVTARPTTLTTVTSSPAVAGSPLTVSGRLTSGTEGVGSAGLLIVRSGCSGDWRGQASTAADGSWSVVDKTPPGGTCSYRATYGGNGTYAPADQSASAIVALRTTNLSLSVVRGTGSNKKLVSVTGQLGTTYTNRRLTITATPAGGTEVVLASSALVDSTTGKLTVTYTPRTTTTYRVSFAGDAWYAGAVAEKVQ